MEDPSFRVGLTQRITLTAALCLVFSLFGFYLGISYLFDLRRMQAASDGIRFSNGNPFLFRAVLYGVVAVLSVTCIFAGYCKSATARIVEACLLFGLLLPTWYLYNSTPAALAIDGLSNGSNLSVVVYLDLIVFPVYAFLLLLSFRNLWSVWNLKKE